MGDISIIARRLKDGHVQYGWSGNGGYFRNVGIRLLAWYDDPEKVEYLFGLGEFRHLGKPGSEKGGYQWNYTTELTGNPHSLGLTEREIFSKILFIDYGYFYDTDYRWYYIHLGPFRIKIPLTHIYYATEKGQKMEFERLAEIEQEIVHYMLGGYLSENAEFAALLKEKSIIPEELYAELQKEEYPLYSLYDRYKEIFSYFDDWILVHTEDEDKRITRYILKKKAEKHVETIEWC